MAFGKASGHDFKLCNHNLRKSIPAESPKGLLNKNMLSGFW